MDKVESSNVALILNYFEDNPKAGGDIIYLNFIKYLCQQGISVHVYCESSKWSEPIKGVMIYSDFSKNKEIYLKNINKDNYDYIISSRIGLRFPDINADVYTLHGHSVLYSKKLKYGLFYKFFRAKQKKLQAEIKSLNRNRDKLFVFCSEQLKDDYCSLVPLGNTAVLNPYPNCFPQEDYKKKENEIFTFGISATGFQNKGGYLALKSAALLKLSGKRFKLKIIYKKKAGILQKCLCSLLGLGNEVEFLSKQNDMHTFYESIDCLLMPSTVESFGMVAAEAMTFNIPVIVSSTCGIKEKIKQGENGYIFDFSKNRTWNLYKQMLNVMDNVLELNINDVLARNPLNTEEKYNECLLQLVQKNGEINHSAEEDISCCHNSYQDRKMWWLHKIEEYGFEEICTVKIDKKPTSGFEFFFTALKDNQKVFIKCGNGDFYAKKEYEVYQILNPLNPKHFPKALMYKNFEDNKMLLVMEYIDGITLNKVDYTDVPTEILNNMFDSLYNIGQVLYKNKYIHRDFHSENLIVEQDGNIKLIDFQHLLGDEFGEAEENIKYPKKLRGTNKRLRPAPYVWDDMYSIWRLMQKFPKDKITNYDEKYGDIKSKVGKQRYYFMDNKFKLKAYFNLKMLFVYKLLNLVHKPIRKLVK